MTTDEKVYGTGVQPEGLAYKLATTVAQTGLTGAGTASTTAVAAGWGAASPPLTFTPAFSGTMEITVTGSITTATAAAVANVQLYYGTGAAPSAGSAPGGTALGSNQAVKINTAASYVPFSITQVVFGTPGTTYWFDAGYYTWTTADHASLATCDISIVELPA
jgi:hypothetical protein